MIYKFLLFLELLVSTLASTLPKLDLVLHPNSKQVCTIIDTGSDVTWIPCSNSGFDPSASPSHKTLTCDAVPCQELVQNADTCSVDNTCYYEVHYGDGTTTGGDFATDTLHFGNSDIPDFPFGCDTQTEDSYGILGLGRGSLSLIVSSIETQLLHQFWMLARSVYPVRCYCSTSYKRFAPKFLYMVRLQVGSESIAFCKRNATIKGD